MDDNTRRTVQDMLDKQRVMISELQTVILYQAVEIERMTAAYKEALAKTESE